MTNKSNTVSEAIGYEMRTMRLIERKTLQQVADALNVTKNTISLWELGKTKITCEDLVRYCDVVGCDWAELLNRVKDKM